MKLISIKVYLLFYWIFLYLMGLVFIVAFVIAAQISLCHFFATTHLKSSSCVQIMSSA